jgi:hypothetical protein
LQLAGGTLALASLAGCAPTDSPEFAVTGMAPSPQSTVFRSTDPNVNDAAAKAYCAGGYEKLGEQSFPTESGGTIQEWRVRCTPTYALTWIPFL